MHIHDVPEVGWLYSVPCRMACSDVFRALRELAFPRTGITSELLLLSNNNTPRDCELWVSVWGRAREVSALQRMGTPRPRVGQPAWVAQPSLADGAVYALGQVTDQKGGECEVQLTGAAEPIRVPATSCWPVNEPGSHALHDLTELHFVHEAALLAHVRERYSAGSIYTYVGPTLVSLNPFRELPGVYGAEAC